MLKPAKHFATYRKTHKEIKVNINMSGVFFYNVLKE